MAEQSIITIMHTNDLHSHFENWPKIRRYLTGQKAILGFGDNGVLTVDIGDAMDLVHPLTEATAGRANVKLLNQIGYDAVTIGNNEGLSLQHDKLQNLYNDTNFPVTVANIKDLRSDDRPSWCQEVVYKVMPDGTKVAMIGMTAPFVEAYPLREWGIGEVAPILAAILPEISVQADVIILLSHLGLPEDRRLAKMFPMLDVIIGAHTHHRLERGEMVNNTLLAAAGKWGRYIGKISLTLENHKIVSKVARLVTTAELPDETGDVDEIQSLLDAGLNQLRAATVAELPSPLRQADNTFMDALFAMLTNKTGVEAAMLSTGLVLADLPAGIVTKADLLAILPHQMYVMRTLLKGKELKRLLQEIHKNAEFVSSFAMVGLGFRGKVFGDLQLRQMAIDIHKGQLTYQNQLIDDQKQYEFVSLDYYKYLPFFPTIDLVGENQIIMQKMLREDFADYLTQNFPVK